MIAAMVFKRRAPLRIRHLRELEPGFKPRWFRYEIRLVFAAVFFGLLSICVGLMGYPGLAYGAIAFCIAAIVAANLLGWMPAILLVFGYWWPSLAVTAVRIEKWLETDLEWGRNS